MKPFVYAAVLAVCVALLSHSVAAFFMPEKRNPVQAVATVPAGDGSLTSPLLNSFNPLNFLLTALGVPVGKLVEGTQKCVADLSPEAIEAVKALKKLLGLLTFMG